MLLNMPAILAGGAALAPAAVVLFAAYGRYDGHFKDTLVFLWFVGGLFLGMGLAVLALLILTAGLEVYSIGLALVAALAFTAILNRRKFRGERHSVFNGGAFASGASVMVTLAFAQAYMIPRAGADALSLLALLGIGTGLTFSMFAAGAWAGRGIAERAPFRHAAVAAAGLVVPFFLFQFYARSGLILGYGSDVALGTSALAAVYGFVALHVGRARVLPLGLPPGEARAMRRAERREQA
ncbi:MAG TPA: hypothetical protein VM889_08625 [Candidatus Thermoplasmatota archaeon]|nr:hypothetical protein [Candidatus Thermoplasmatota archaeon]